MAATINHTSQIGVDYTYDLLVKDSNGDAIDLVTGGYSSALKVRRNYKNTAAEFLSLTSSGSTITLHRGSTTGRVSITLTAADTASLIISPNDDGYEQLVYDWTLTDSSGVISTVAEGNWNFHQFITRA